MLGAGTNTRSARSCTDWYLQHGEALQGDEDTDDYYSDDEYEEDARAVKRTRKEIVNVVSGYNRRFRQSAEQLVREDMPSATVGDGQVTNQGVFFAVQSPQKPMHIAMRAREIDPQTNSAFAHWQDQKYDPKTGALTTAYVSHFTYDVERVIADYLDAKWYPYNFFWTAVFVLSGALTIAKSWRYISAYLSARQAALLAGVALSVTIYSGAPLPSRPVRVVLGALALVASVALGGLLA